jgi:hypothetical protein
MGTTQSRYDEDDYSIDAEVVNSGDALNVPNMPTPIELKYSKMYIIYQRINGMSRTYALTIKIIDNSIFVYVTDIFSEKTKLAHVSTIGNPHSSNIGTNSENDIVHYLKYIQISRDFKLISLPENGSVNVYNLTNLLNRNILEHVDTIGIVLSLDKSSDETGVIRSKIEIKDKSTRGDLQSNEFTNDLTDRIGHIKMNDISSKDLSLDRESDHETDLELQPYKCVLCKDLFIVVCVESVLTVDNHWTNQYKKIVIIDYTNKKVHTIKNINLNVNRSAFRFSTNGRFVVAYDNTAKSVLMSDMLEEREPKFKEVNLTFDAGIILESICISEDGRFIFYIEDENKSRHGNNSNMKFNIYDTKIHRIYELDSKVNINDEYGHDKTNNHLNDLKFHLMDYSSFTKINFTDSDETNCNKLYVLVGWNKKTTSAKYWMIRCSEKDYIIYEPSSIQMSVDGPIEYIYNNGYMFIYKTKSGITAYDLNRIIPMKFANILAAESKYDINKLYKQYFQSMKDKYYSEIIIIGADDSKVVYSVTDYISFLFSLIKETNKKDSDTNEFQLRVNANISIYGNVKSFTIFQDLLTGKSKQSEIISNIFTLKGQTGRHNMMRDLMNHMYEYTREIALKETIKNNEVQNESTERSKFNDMKAIYIGYVLLILVIKYYLVLVKTSNHEYISSIETKVNTKVNTKSMTKSPAVDRRLPLQIDIMKTFNDNFPIFKSFTDKTLSLILGDN